MLQQFSAPTPQLVTCLPPTGFHSSVQPPDFHSQFLAPGNAQWLLISLAPFFFSIMLEQDAEILFCFCFLQGSIEVTFYIDRIETGESICSLFDCRKNTSDVITIISDTYSISVVSISLCNSLSNLVICVWLLFLLSA